MIMPDISGSLKIRFSENIFLSLAPEVKLKVKIKKSKLVYWWKDWQTIAHKPKPHPSSYVLSVVALSLQWWNWVIVWQRPHGWKSKMFTIWPLKKVYQHLDLTTFSTSLKGNLNNFWMVLCSTHPYFEISKENSIWKIWL